MLSIPANARLFLCNRAVNMKKSFEGLSKIVEELFPEELFNGAFFIFVNRRKDHMKVLYWDGDGFVIWFKRLEKGIFAIQKESKLLDRRTLLMLLEGVVPKQLQKRFSIQK